MYKKKLTITTLEKQCELSQNSIKKWGVVSPKADSLNRVASSLNVSVDYLLGRTENKETATTENLFKIKKAPESLSEDEQELLKQYKGLDSHSKAALLELAKNLNINKSNINKSNTERKIK